MELLDWLPTLFDKRDESGALAYSDAEMRDFLAAMLLSIGFDAAELTPETERLIADLSRRAGVDPAGTREEGERALTAYFEANPLNPTLVREFKQGLREAFVRESGGRIASAFTKYLETGPRKLLEDRPEPPPGAVRGGPLGFFIARKKLE